MNKRSLKGLKVFPKRREVKKHGFFIVEDPVEDAFVPPWSEMLGFETGDLGPGPEISLELERVYGYSCFNTRQNLFYTRNPAEIVYPAGPLGVIFNTQTKTQRFFLEHSNSITALAVHPGGDKIATGSFDKNSKVCIWGTNMDLLQKLKTKSAVSCLGFSSESFLAAAELGQDPSVLVWDLSKNELIFSSQTGRGNILSLSWNSASSFLTVGYNHLFLWSYSENIRRFKKLKWFLESDFFILTAVAGSKDLTFCSDKNGTVYKWKNESLVLFKAIHELSSVHCLAVKDQVITGGTDKCIKFSDFDLNILNTFHFDSAPRSIDLKEDRILAGFLDGSIREVKMDQKQIVLVQGFKGELLAVDVCGEDQNCFVSLSKDGSVKTLDGSSHQIIECRLMGDSNTACLSVDKTKGSVAVGFLGGKIAILDHWRTLNTANKLNDADDDILVLSFSPNTQFLAAGCKDLGIYIYETGEYNLRAKLMGHKFPAKSIDWTEDSKFIKTNSEALEFLCFDIEICALLKQINNGKYSTWTCKICSADSGLLFGLPDIAQILSVDTRDNYLAFGNIFGQIKICEFPYLTVPKFLSYSAHSDHVASVKWSLNSKYLYSCGGSDRTVIQWKVII